MKIIIEERSYSGTAAEILDQLRDAYVPEECPSVDDYILFLQARFITLTSRTCDLPVGSTERRARAIIDHFISIGAMREEEE